MLNVHHTAHTLDDLNSFPLLPDARSNDWADRDVAENNDAQVSLKTILERANADAPMPLRMALSAIRDNLDRRTREWRGSAKVVEQTLRQLVSAEQSRAAALEQLARVEAEVARTGQALTQAFASFDETGESRNIDPRFSQSDIALDELDRVTAELSIAQHCCRSAWKSYSDALEAEEQLRLHIQQADRSA